MSTHSAGPALSGLLLPSGLHPRLPAPLTGPHLLFTRFSCLFFPKFSSPKLESFFSPESPLLLILFCCIFYLLFRVTNNYKLQVSFWDTSPTIVHTLRWYNWWLINLCFFHDTLIVKLNNRDLFIWKVLFYCPIPRGSCMGRGIILIYWGRRTFQIRPQDGTVTAAFCCLQGWAKKRKHRVFWWLTTQGKSKRFFRFKAFVQFLIIHKSNQVVWAAVFVHRSIWPPEWKTALLPSSLPPSVSLSKYWSMSFVHYSRY